MDRARGHAGWAIHLKTQEKRVLARGFEIDHDPGVAGAGLGRGFPLFPFVPKRATLARAPSMKKAALLFAVSILGPSLALAWLALRSLRDQHLVLERQEALLQQAAADALAGRARAVMVQFQQGFQTALDGLLNDRAPRDAAPEFHHELRTAWPAARVGFAVTLDGTILAPSTLEGRNERAFLIEQAPFLQNVVAAQVFSANRATPRETASGSEGKVAESWDRGRSSRQEKPGGAETPRAAPAAPGARPAQGPGSNVAAKDAMDASAAADRVEAGKSKAPREESEQVWQAARAPFLARKLVPQKQADAPAAASVSSLVVEETGFAQLAMASPEGLAARFVQNELRILIWRRSERDPQIVFGAELDLDKVRTALQAVTAPRSANGAACFAIVDDAGRPAARSLADFEADWKRPFVAAEIGEALPHWEAAVYLTDAGAITRSAATLRWTLGGLIAALVLAIGAGGWLLGRDVGRELDAARRKADFVANVSHELKTPLTSIRMFSELLSEGRVKEEDRRRHCLEVITAEAARLTRLINNVLDFSRLERGAKKYRMEPVDLARVAARVVATVRPQLEAAGFTVAAAIPDGGAEVHGDEDALWQVLMNLLSNAEKYGGPAKAIDVVLESSGSRCEARVGDRGGGVPRGHEERIFEKFHRAHDSLASGIQGSGLGLTLARQIARAHGGDVRYQPRHGGGSWFILELPASRAQPAS